MIDAPIHSLMQRIIGLSPLILTYCIIIEMQDAIIIAPPKFTLYISTSVVIPGSGRDLFPIFHGCLGLNKFFKSYINFEKKFWSF